MFTKFKSSSGSTVIMELMFPYLYQMNLHFLKAVSLSCFFIIASFATAIAQNKLFIRLTQPGRESNRVSNARQYISGSTCKGCNLTVNGDSVYVYPTGAFAIQLDLKPGDNTFLLTSFDSTGNAYTKNIFYRFTAALPPRPVTGFSIESVVTYPDGNVLISPGDTIRIRVKALPGCRAGWLNGLPLTELPLSQTGDMPGIYTGSYIVQPHDSLIKGRLKVDLQNTAGNRISQETTARFNVLDSPLTAATFDNLGFLTYGIEGDRLGPVKMEYLDSAVLLSVTGKINDYYKVKLSPGREAYINDVNIDLLKDSSFSPVSPVSFIKTGTDAKFDYIAVGLTKRLPYHSFQQPDSSQIIIDIFGAVADKQWMAALQNNAEIRTISTQGGGKDVFRLALTLKHPQYWGYRVYYSGNSLIIRVKHPPAQMDLGHLTIGVDAGHGGGNVGAQGPTGVYEKMLTLPIALKLAADLEKEGAKVILDRRSDSSFNNEDRLSFFRNADPDILVSVHLNSSADPVHIAGTATYYKYPGNRPLAAAIYQRMQQTGLKGFGCFGGFNFILNEPTEFPNVLVETLFLSNPADEMKALDDNFQQQMADAIVQGIKDFLSGAKTGNDP